MMNRLLLLCIFFTMPGCLLATQPVTLYLTSQAPVAAFQADLSVSGGSAGIDSVVLSPSLAGFRLLHHENRLICYDRTGRNIAAGYTALLHLYLNEDYNGAPVVLKNQIVVDSLLQRTEHGALSIGEATSVQADREAKPMDLRIHPLYPNPLNGHTVLRIDLPQQLPVKVVLYNLLGQRLKTIVDESLPAGNHTIHVDVTTLASGVYFAFVQAGTITARQKIVLIR
ncbi:T9SS type A sorting domain-containing protein [candidate division KSB1 bacterium]|nr:T9SS type A sorting domain-containing protein [candidate division KSB1 bacterium]